MVLSMKSKKYRPGMEDGFRWSKGKTDFQLAWINAGAEHEVIFEHSPYRIDYYSVLIPYVNLKYPTSRVDLWPDSHIITYPNGTRSVVRSGELRMLKSALRGKKKDA